MDRLHCIEIDIKDMMVLLKDNMPKLYTRAGDRGNTRMYTGELMMKDSNVCRAVGLCDTINVSIGAFKAGLKGFMDVLQKRKIKNHCICCVNGRANALNHTLDETIEDLHGIIDDQVRIQRLFLNIASTIASTRKGNEKLFFDDVDDTKEAKYLEKKIDNMTAVLPELKVFLLMGETPLSTNAHRSRVDIRSFERFIVGDQAIFPIQSYKYINRLSDYYFQLARYVDHLQTREEIRDGVYDDVSGSAGRCFDFLVNCATYIMCFYLGSFLVIPQQIQ